MGRGVDGISSDVAGIGDRAFVAGRRQSAVLRRCNSEHHDFWPLGIAKIEIVGNGERLSSNGGYVAPAFCNGLFTAFEWIGLAVARRNIRGEREAFRPIFDTNHRRIAARSLHRVAEDDVIVLLPNPTLRAKIRRFQQLLQCFKSTDRRMQPTCHCR